jgi:uncharacterized membrane protein SirB2
MMHGELFWQDHAALGYAVLLHAHRALVGMSVMLFVLRAIGVAGHNAWPMKPVVRWSSVLIDTTLMVAGIALWVLLQHNPVHEPWLALKLLLLLVYIVLGSYGLKRGRTRAARISFSLLALLVVLQMVWIARTRNPMGLLGLLSSP